MTEQATILIPDISGFTEFVTRTELDHSSHIINELLELIVGENYTGFSLSEIEGDAVLFYKKGDIPTKQILIKQCIDTFSRFHELLKIMERDIICKCGACQGASKLSLKFIIHRGTIKEFRIADIVKAAGIDMIIAHRLLKNTINSNEYILLSSTCIDCFPDKEETVGLIWNKHTESYPAIGEIQLEFADLQDIKEKIPAVPERQTHISHDGGDTLEIEIEAPIDEVYQKAIDLDLLTKWMIGVNGIRRGNGVERIGTKHVCLTPEFELEVELDYAEFLGETALIINKFSIQGTEFSGVGTDWLKKTGEKQTLLTETSMWNVPGDLRQEMLSSIKLSLELFKALCEGKEVKKELLQN